MTITGDIAQWLEEIGLSCYEQSFREQGYELDSIKAMGLKDEDYEALQITKRGHINKINLSLAKQRGPVISAGSFDRNGTLNELIHFTRKELSGSGLNESNCWQLIELTEKINGDITSLVWNYIDKNCKNALNSSQFLSISEKTLISLVQRETIEIKEVDLFLAVSKWLNVNNVPGSQIFSHIRFGLFTADELLLAEKSSVPGVQFLYAAWRKLADKKAVALKDVPRNYFSFRIGQQQFVVSLPVVLPAGKRYELKVSSLYSDYPEPSYELLTNDAYNSPGAATSFAENQWIQASFDSQVLVTKISVGASSADQFADEGWNGTYVQNALIQASDDGENWRNIGVVPNQVNEVGLTEIILVEPVTATHFRLFKAERGWLATGSLIFE